MENKMPEIAKIIGKTIEDEAKSFSITQLKKIDLGFRFLEEWADALCLIIRVAGLLIASLLVVFIIFVIGVMLGYDPSQMVRDLLKHAVFEFDSVEGGKIFTKRFKIPFEAFLLIAIFIWRFSPTAFLKNKSKSDSIDDSSK